MIEMDQSTGGKIPQIESPRNPAFLMIAHGIKQCTSQNYGVFRTVNILIDKA
jgi:hypothetical protein